MRRRASVYTRFVWIAIRTAMRLSDAVRTRASYVLPTVILVVAVALLLTTTTSAHMRMLKSWDRLFGSSRTQTAQVGVKSEVSGGISGYTTTTFDAPDAGTSAANGTIGVSIDAAGDVAGTYIDSNLVAHGFFRAANGTFTEFNAPDAGSSAMQGTFAISMDSTGGYIAGMYADSANAYHGFVRAASGAITEFDAGSSYVHNGTIAANVNSSGIVIGVYSGGSFHGFVRSANGTITLFDAPGAGSGGQPQGTIPIGINSSGMITGLYEGANGIPEGFVRAVGGTITEFQVPCQGSTCYATAPMSIDSAGDIVGAYGASGVFKTGDINGQTVTMLGHGFIRSASGTISTFDPPGSTVGSALVGGQIGGTLPLSIDPGGNYVAGFYSDANNIEHGFLQTPSSITTFDAPGAATSSLLPLTGTGAGGVNISGAIAGAYVDSNGVVHGLLLTPTPPVTPSFAIAGTSISVNPGAITGNTSIITVTPSGGFTGSIVLTAAITSSPTGAQFPPALSFGSTSPVSISGLTAGTAALTINTTASSTSSCTAGNRMQRGVPWFAGGGGVLACVLLFGISPRRRSLRKVLGMLVLLIALSGGVLACGGGGSGTSNCPTSITSGTTAGTYTVTVTGTSGMITTTGTVALTVQ